MADLAIVVGDTHLAERTWAGRRTLTGDSFNSFLQAVDIAISTGLPMVLLGDIFDAKSVSSAVLQFFCVQMSKLQSHGIRVFYVQGNHDYATPPWPSVHEWPAHMHGQLVHFGAEQDTCICYGLDYMATAKYAEALAAIPANARVLFTHQAWADFGKMGSSDAAMSQMLPRDITVITGDLHMPIAATGVAANGARVDMFSPGTTCMQAINEPQEHYVYKMSMTAGQLTLKPIQLKTRRVYEFICTVQEEFDAAVLQIAGLPGPLAPTDYDISAAIVRIRYPIAVSSDSYVRLVTAATKSGVHLFTDPQLEPPPQSSIVMEDVHTEKMSTLGDAINLLEAEPQEVRDLAARMLDQSDNVLGFLTSFQTEYAAGVT